MFKKLPPVNVRLTIGNKTPTIATIKIKPKAALKVAKVLKVVGVVFAVAGGIKAYEDYQNGRYAKAALGAAFTEAGFSPGIGWVASGVWGLWGEDYFFPEDSQKEED